LNSLMKASKRARLAQAVCAGRAGGLGLQGQVHCLKTPTKASMTGPSFVESRASQAKT
jgi:hypothetical protein